MSLENVKKGDVLINDHELRATLFVKEIFGDIVFYERHFNAEIIGCTKIELEKQGYKIKQPELAECEFTTRYKLSAELRYCKTHESYECSHITSEPLKLELGKVYEDKFERRYLIVSKVDGLPRFLGVSLHDYCDSIYFWEKGKIDHVDKFDLIKLSPDQRPYRV